MEDLAVEPLILTTRRGLMLRPLRASDVAALHTLWTSPGVRRFLWDDEVVSLARTEAAVVESERLFRSEGRGLWGARRADGAGLIAFAGFWYFRAPPELELLYGVGEDEWGHGHATDVARAVMNYGFAVLRMPAIHASTDAGNTASVRVLEKLGFTRTPRVDSGRVETLFFMCCEGAPHVAP